MTRIIDRWLHAHRLSRAIFVAVAAGGALLYTLWTWPPPMVSRLSQSGKVVSVVVDGVTVIELADGKRVRALTPQPPPKPGDGIPMVVETYNDGSVMATIDLESWRTAPR